MKIIIAPAKKMVVDTDTFACEGRPQYLDRTQLILDRLRQLSYPEAKVLWHCSDKLAQPNYDWLHQLDLTRQLTPTLLAFSGIQYQYMAPDLFTAPALNYVRTNLRILSGFYGILRPFDGVVPYRLEMQSRLPVADAPNLYAFWGSQLYQALTPTPEPIINLASREYAKTITPYLAPNQPFVTVTFGSLVAGKLKTKATLAKMARGEMVRFLAERQAQHLNDVAAFNHPDWAYAPERSTPDNFVFIYQKTANSHSPKNL
ncbi:peroxide stress protein YaaA [Levilactobacillus tujiorum]|uniref:peroxide stress protein YaaA n=1 Tax=Levilactobacillus tujiorum TaxID=2912243 RepID=UPI0014565E11|nr:peroxide stress protein YaaA [Levilactobacillus tujiorum]NLR30970.1 peroxide stress protein YaaA [Levilactobacillus tujiorum]